jgi:hypothetical protein
MIQTPASTRNSSVRCVVYGKARIRVLPQICRISLYIGLSLSPFIGGCSMVVSSCTKEVSESMYQHGSRGRIESMIGPPLSEQSYHAPYPTTRDLNGRVGLAATKAYYEYHGRADDGEQFQGLGMLSGMTLGLGEVIAFPESIKLSQRLQRSFHRYYVWYDDQGRCVALQPPMTLGAGNE